MTLMLAQLVGFVASFFAALFVLRFVLQWARAPFRNPIGRFVITLTDWGVRPLRRVVPGWRGNDLASLVMAWLIETASLIVVLLIVDAPLVDGGNLVPLAFIAGFIEMLRTLAYVILGAAIGVVVLSWINPQAPMAPVFQAVAEPFLRPFQRVIPPIGGIDLSPLFLLFVLQALLGVLAFAKSSVLGIHL
jgi:YggT family protein